MTLVVGLTGGIASGKSTVSNMFKEKGFTVIDADKESRYVVEKGKPAYNEIVKTFGEDILQPDGNIDRAKLGAIVFNDKEKREMLNRIVHPAVRKEMVRKKEEAVAKGERLVVLDIPLLLEGNLQFMVDKVLLVYVDEQTQLKRLMERNQYSKEEALARIHSQMPLEKKVELSDEIINNNGTLEETKRQLNEILEKWNII